MDQLASLRRAISNCEARLASIALQERIVVAHPESVRDPSYVHRLMNEKRNLQKKLKELKQVEKRLVSREAIEAPADNQEEKGQIYTVKESKKSLAKKPAPLRPPRPKVGSIGDLNELKRRKSLSQVQAAAELGLNSTRQVRNLLRDGKLTKTAKGRVAVDDKFEEQFHLRHSARPK